MTDFIAQVPVQMVTDPLLLWLFKHGWEDPEWGRMPFNQVALGLALHNIGAKVADGDLAKQIQAIAQKVVADNAQRIVK